MSAATWSTSSKRSFSYRLWVNPRPVRAIAASASLQRTRSRRKSVGSASVTPATLERAHQLLHGRDDTRVERAEFGVHGRGLVEAHRVHDVLEIVGVHAEQG